MSSKPEAIAVVGAGAWGTALALHLSAKKIPVDLWVYEEDLAIQMTETRENRMFLPGFPLPEWISPSSSIESVVSGKDHVVLVTPSHVVRQIVRTMRPFLKPSTLLINASKGLEENTLLPVSNVLREELGEEIALVSLSGPTFAKEVARRVPSAMVAASRTLELAEQAQSLFSTPDLKVFTSADPTGVEMGGSLKNVIAIAAGISDGLELGYNARAGLITRGLVEISRIGTAMGAKPETFSGLSGLGDLVLTCTGDLSRNRTVGMQLGQGKTLDEITRGMDTVAEGIRTVKSAFALKEKFQIQASIIDETYRVLYENKPPRQALRDLMKVETNQEFSGVRGLK